MIHIGMVLLKNGRKEINQIENLVWHENSPASPPSRDILPLADQHSTPLTDKKTRNTHEGRQ
jgi:hypothetical protein